MGMWHIVKQGEWLAQIAAHYGIADGKTIWNDSHNAKVKQARSPEILFPGDRLYIPDKSSKPVARATGRQHDFVTKGPQPEALRVKVLNADGTPLAHQPYRLTVGGQKFSGVTTGEGEVVAHGITSRGGHGGKLDFHKIGLTFPVAVGHLNPAHEKKPADGDHYDGGVSGIQMRLTNLGFDPGPPSGVLGPQTKSALQCFQATVMLLPAEKVTGDLDAETRSAIIKAYGC